MGKFVHILLHLFGKLGSLFLSPTFFQRFKQMKDAVYSSWISSFCKNKPEGFSVEYPVIFRGHKHMHFGKNFGARGHLRIEVFDGYLGQVFKPELIIGDNVYFNFNCHIGCIDKILIGNNVLVGSNVLITDHFHGDSESLTLEIVPSQRPLITKGPVIIEDNVWIGENVSIMPGVTIGRGSVIGSNSVVTKSFPAKTIIGGIPAKKIK